MLSKSEILIIKRFLFSKKTEGYVSIFSWFSIIGISLGVSAIIIVMSVMNGFRINLTERLIGINSHLNIYSFNSTIQKTDVKLLREDLNYSLSKSALSIKVLLTPESIANIKKKLLVQVKEILSIASALESESNHPLASAIHKSWSNVTSEKVNVVDIRTIAGMGLVGKFDFYSIK